MNISDMVDPNDARISVPRDGEPAGDGPVLLWVQHAQRASGNAAVNLAVALADALDRELVAAFCLVPSYPRATLRAYRCMAEGLAELPDGFAERGIGWVLRTGEPGRVIPAVARDLRAALIVVDQDPTNAGRRWRAEVAGAAGLPMTMVDADVVVPTVHLPKLEFAPRTMRPKILRLLPRYLVPVDDPEPRRRSTVRESPDPLDLVAGLDIDRSVGPAPYWPGGQSHARARLARFLDRTLPTYAETRNGTDPEGMSGLSRYLHYGQISPVEVAVAASEAFHSVAATDVEDGATAKGGEGDGTTTGGTALESFLDELIVQRELSINLTIHEPRYETFDAVPDWGKRTLAAHAADPRETILTCDQLEACETPDRLWNAAQRQMIHEGYLPNRLRMYWAKQIPLWTATAEEAHAHTVHLNDKYFVDGRDPTGYAQIAWAVGGRHDRPFPPNRPIVGLVRPLGIRAMKKHFDPETYIRDMEKRWPK